MRFSGSLLTPLLLVVLLSGHAVDAWGEDKKPELDLARCLRLARENNLDLANAVQEIRKAENSVTMADGARLPEVDLTTTYTRMKEETAVIPGVEIPDTQADISIGAAMPLYTM